MSATNSADHSDSVARKLELLKAAYSNGNLATAVSLAESLKDGLQFERQTVWDAFPIQLPTTTFQQVSELPTPLVQWAHGWSFYKSLTLFETVGIARTAEPVELGVEFASSQVSDVVREVRVARWHPGERRVREVTSQIYNVTRDATKIRCQVAFFAEAGPHEAAHYLIFFGNENAELPEYPTDLRVAGEGVGLEIASRHYQARLSKLSGQLERLMFKREHGLELYAAGKGHGEPPCIDWAHDYVEQGNFQKVRMRNSPRWPNYDVIKGPIFARLRRFGFPYSPLYPVFTPSRMHMDVAYTFYAGLPYFVKEGQMDAIQEFRTETIRDDEWVFSGYSFTDSVWIDAAGKLHEGEVPPAQADDLWGVGFFHRNSRDAFIALWLEHSARGFEKLKHDGAPILHYPAHGQLWSRHQLGGLLKAGTSFHQKNAYLVDVYPKEDAATKFQQIRHRLMNPLEFRNAAAAPSDLSRAAVTALTLARPGETTKSAPLKPAIWKTLRQVKDEQFYSVDSNVVDMGYIYDVRERDGMVRIFLTMPHRGRPVYEFLETQGGGRVEEGIRERILKVPGVRDVVLEFSWEPAWTSARLTEQGRQAMGLVT